MPSTGFKPAILGLQTHALDCAATRQSCVIVLLGKNTDLEAIEIRDRYKGRKTA